MNSVRLYYRSQMIMDYNAYFQPEKDCVRMKH
jgi:hypothetical protein